MVRHSSLRREAKSEINSAAMVPSRLPVAWAMISFEDDSMPRNVNWLPSSLGIGAPLNFFFRVLSLA